MSNPITLSCRPGDVIHKHRISPSKQRTENNPLPPPPRAAMARSYKNVLRVPNKRGKGAGREKEERIEFKIKWNTIPSIRATAGSGGGAFNFPYSQLKSSRAACCVPNSGRTNQRTHFHSCSARQRKHTRIHTKHTYRVIYVSGAAAHGGRDGFIKFNGP
jgi:hypothetical protein